MSNFLIYWKAIFSRNPSASSMRYGFILGIILAGVIAILGIIKGCNILHLSALCGVFTGSAYGGKSLSKKYEVMEKDRGADGK